VVTGRLSFLQCSDLHFGRDADLEQIAALEGLAADLAPSAVAIAGDLTQRARMG
jgi:predicted MPP superfamily phosphohydrolase